MIFPGFVGPAYQTRLVQTSAEQCINLYPESLESPSSPAHLLRRVPGLAATITGLAGAVRGQFQQDGRAFAVGGGTLYETTTGAAVSLGAVANDGRPVTFETNGSQNGAGGHQVILASGGCGYLFDLNTNTFSQIAVAGFPTGQVLTVGYMDGLFLVVTPTFVGQSALEDGSTWNAAARASRSIATDNLVTAIVNYPQHTLWLFGSKRTEVWYDNAGAVFSFGPIPGVFVNIGCGARWSPTRFNNGIAWLGLDENGTRVVYFAQQYVPQRISTLAVEDDLATFADVSDFIGFAYEEAGHLFYVLTSQTNQRTWVYDGKEGLWHRRGLWNAASGRYQAIRGLNHVVSPSGTHWIGDATIGTIYTQSLTTYDDAGAPLRWVRRAPHLVQQQHRILYPGFVLDAQKGIGLSSGQGSTPNVALRWSNDGGETFGNELWRSLGAQGQYSARAIWRALGQGRNRVWEVSGSDPVPVALIGAYLDPDPVGLAA